MVPVVVKAKTFVRGEKVNLLERLKVQGNVLKIYYSFGTEVVLTDKATYLNKQPMPFTQVNRVIGFTPRQNHAIIAWIENGSIKVYDATSRFEMRFAGVADSLI